MSATSTRFPHLVASGAAGLAAWGVISAQIRHNVAVGGQHSHHRTPGRNRLAYELTGNLADPQAPLVVLESGHQASARYWHWVVEHLAPQFPVLSYSRAGYGGSEFLARGSYSLASSVEDLLSLVQAVRGSRRVVLVGHSLGAYLAYRAASSGDLPVQALVLLDPTHPEETVRIPARAEGAGILDQSNHWVAFSMRAGLGIMLEIPDWVSDFPAPVRRLIRAEMRDYGLWSASVREWNSLHQLFRSPPPLVDVPAPVSVIAAEATVEMTPEQRGLFEDYVSHGSGGGKYREIPGANHLSMLSSPDLARQVAASVLECIGAGE